MALTWKGGLPDEPWLCRGWLSSWVAASEPYDDRSAWRADTWEHPRLQAEFPHSAAKRFAAFYGRRAELLAGLRRLPQVFTHNDAWPPNLIWGGDGALTAIDWAFAGIAGIGEEMGRMYGLCLHQSLPEGLMTAPSTACCLMPTARACTRAAGAGRPR